MFFNVPDDLTRLDFSNGQCHNASVKQNVTFSEQGLPFGLSKNAAGMVQAPSTWLLAIATGLFTLSFGTGLL